MSDIQVTPVSEDRIDIIADRERRYLAIPEDVRKRFYLAFNVWIAAEQGFGYRALVGNDFDLLATILYEAGVLK